MIVKITDIRREGQDVLLVIQVTLSPSTTTIDTATQNDTPWPFKRPEYTVTRSLADFERLYLYLRNCHHHILIPAPPTLAALELPIIKYSARKFLSRILNHNVLIHNDGVVAFFESEYLILHAPPTIPGLSPKSTRNKIMSILPTDLKDPDEHLDLAKTETTRTELVLQEWLKHAEDMARIQVANANAFDDTSIRLGALHDMHVPHTDIFLRSSHCLKKAAETYYLHSRYLGSIFCELIYLQIRNTQTMTCCFQYRLELLKSYDYACKRTQRKLGEMNSLKQSKTIKQYKVDAAIEQVNKAKQLEETGKTLFKATSDTLRSEYAAFQRNRDQDMTEQILSYAKKQLLLHQNLLYNLQQCLGDEAINTFAS